MKRRIAAILALCMALQGPGSALEVYGSTSGRGVFLEEVSEESAEFEKASKSDADGMETINTSETAAADGESEEKTKAMGGLYVEIRNLLEAPGCDFHLWLEPTGNTQRILERKEELEDKLSSGWDFEEVWDTRSKEEIIASGEGAKRVASQKIMDIPEGDYLLHLESAGESGFYLPYTQKISIRSGQIKKLYLANDFPEDHNRITEADDASDKEEKNRINGKFGLLIPGNFMQDGIKDELLEEDMEALLDAVDNGADTPEAFDLNGDGNVDLLDINCFSKFYQNDDKRSAKIVDAPYITEDMVQPLDADGDKIESAEIQKLFSGAHGNDGNPVFSASAGSDITADNPVEIKAEFTQSVQNVRGFAITPKTGSLDFIQDGKIEVVDANGKLYSFGITNGVAKLESTKTINLPADDENGEDGRKESNASTEPDAVASPSDAEVSTFSLHTLDEAAQESPEETLTLSFKEARAEDDWEKGKQAKPILIDFGRQIPVKRVTILITKTMNQSNLAEIAHTEFLNGMEDHIPEPDLSIPDKLKGVPGDAQFSVSWRSQPNVTGYQVMISGETMKGMKENIEFPIQVSNTITVSKLDGEELANNKTFQVRVRSVNGEWRSPYCPVFEVSTEAASKPKPPEQISIRGGFQKLTVSWKKMKATDSYNLYYREKTGNDTEFTAITGITGTSKEITGLKDSTTYELYMTGQNQIGVSDPSQRYEGRTVIITPPQTPDFMLLNVPKAGGGPSEKIVSVNNHGGDVVGDEFAIVDGQFETVWIRNDWDAGCVYFDNNKSPIITFDQAYTMDTVVIIPDYEQKFNYSGCKLVYWDEEDNQGIAEGRLTRLLDEDGIPYYEFIAREPFTAKKVRVAVTTGYSRRISFAELKFYEYYPLEDEIFAMYTDTLHIMLKDDVTEDKINGFYERLEYVDPVSGEKTPRYAFLKQELDNAMDLLHNKGSIGRVLYLDDKLTKRSDSHINFGGGLNTWQPLGVTGLAGDKVILYVGGEGKIEGDNTSLSVIATQYYGESSSVFQSVGGSLKVGLNEITIPRISQMSSAEAGGQLYIQYGGTSGAEKYAVRVTIPETEAGKSKAALIPMINLYNDLDGTTQEERIETYLKELDNIDPETLHNACHGSIENEYNPQTCIFGATDIAGKRVMFSLPSAQIKSGLGSGEARAEKLTNTVEAMDQLLTLCYQHKGVSDDETIVNNKKANAGNEMPVSRINIRYQRMFEGAFMYAGGAHIGIGWGSAAGMMAGVPVETDDRGKYRSGSLFGWGIAHEIGHEINEGAYAVAEVTNNYYAQLAKSRDSDATTRWGDYSKVYDKVTSGAKGPAANGAVQLAMYWQLHLAYDKDYNFKIYDKYTEQMNSLIFARMDSYARKPANAPKPGDIALSVNSDKDNNLMRLACAAAEKNILEFFERWGMEPNAETKAYANQFPKETRAIWLVSDDKRVKAMEAGNAPESYQATVDGSVSYDEMTDNNIVRIDLETSDTSDKFIGYEIFRIERKGEDTIRTAVKFVPADGSSTASTEDVIATVNNRAFTYEVVGYNLWLQPTEAVVIGQARVSHDGNLDRTNWSATTNMLSDNPPLPGEGDDEEPDAVVDDAILCVIDNDNGTTFTGRTTETHHADGKVTPAQDPEVIIYLNGEETLTALEYRLAANETSAIGRFTIEVSANGTTWTKVSTKEGEDSFNLSETIAADGTRYHRIVFSKKNADSGNYELCTYDASMVKLTAPGQAGQQISISEIKLYGQTGDKIDLLGDGIGILQEDYINPNPDTETPNEVLIPRGSLVFTGQYAGNPAYNIVLLWDENGKVVGGKEGEALKAGQLIFAPDPGEGDLTNISDGNWIYYIEPENLTGMTLPKQVRAELYRVDDAKTNEGQRLVSSTVFVDMPVGELPDNLPPITIKETAFPGKKEDGETVENPNTDEEILKEEGEIS